MDCRADIKIVMHIYGKRCVGEFNINWWPNHEYGMDERVVEWFVSQVNEARAAADEVPRETAERAELARLKAKYEP